MVSVGCYGSRYKWLFHCQWLKDWTTTSDLDHWLDFNLTGWQMCVKLSWAVFTNIGSPKLFTFWKLNKQYEKEKLFRQHFLSLATNFYFNHINWKFSKMKWVSLFLSREEEPVLNFDFSSSWCLCSSFCRISSA